MTNSADTENPSSFGLRIGSYLYSDVKESSRTRTIGVSSNDGSVSYLRSDGEISTTTVHTVNDFMQLQLVVKTEEFNGGNFGSPSSSKNRPPLCRGHTHEDIHALFETNLSSQ